MHIKNKKWTMFRLKESLACLVTALISIIVVMLSASPAKAAHTVLGTITYSDGKPAVGVQVIAKDSDGMGDLNKNDTMGEAITDSQGFYRINYKDKEWDYKIPGSDAWRPDIFIVIFRNGSHVAKSKVHDDWNMRNNLTINLTIPADQLIEKFTGFKSEIHGWPFSNKMFNHTCVEVLGQKVCGPFSLCGGMSLSALRRFEKNLRVEPFSDKVKQEIEKAQGDTMSAGVMKKFAEWSMIPTQPGMTKPHTIGARTKDEWVDVRKAIDGGRPVVLGLIRVNDDDIRKNPQNVFKNHQVLAIGYRVNDAIGDAIIYIYDPNHPGKTGIISFNTKLPRSQINAKQDTGEKVRGFFVVSGGDGGDEGGGEGGGGRGAPHPRQSPPRQVP